MDGLNCPKCGKPSQWLSTTNEWAYYCTRHGRFNSRNEFIDANPLNNALDCRCGGRPKDVWFGDWCHLRCPKCKDCERGSHKTVENAVSAWNDAMRLPGRE